MSVAADLHTTPREREILTWLSHGKTTSEICEILGVTKFTVETHKQHAMDRLGAANVTALVAKALRGKIID